MTCHSKLRLFPLKIRKDKKNYIVEETVSGDFYEMPKLCVDAIQLINQGYTLGAVEEILKENYPDDDVDVMSFAEQLITFGLVQSIDGITICVQRKKNRRTGFQWVPPAIGRFFFNRFSYTLYALIFLSNIFILIKHPYLVPNYRDVFLFDSMLFNLLTYSSITLTLIFIHEFAHVRQSFHHLPAAEH